MAIDSFIFLIAANGFCWLLPFQYMLHKRGMTASYLPSLLRYPIFAIIFITPRTDHFHVLVRCVKEIIKLFSIFCYLLLVLWFFQGLMAIVSVGPVQQFMIQLKLIIITIFFDVCTFHHVQSSLILVTTLLWLMVFWTIVRISGKSLVLLHLHVYMFLLWSGCRPLAWLALPALSLDGHLLWVRLIRWATTLVSFV